MAVIRAVGGGVVVKTYVWRRHVMATRWLVIVGAHTAAVYAIYIVAATAYAAIRRQRRRQRHWLPVYWQLCRRHITRRYAWRYGMRRACRIYSQHGVAGGIAWRRLWLAMAAGAWLAVWHAIRGMAFTAAKAHISSQRLWYTSWGGMPLRYSGSYGSYAA